MADVLPQTAPFVVSDRPTEPELVAKYFRALGDPTRLHQLLMNLCTNAVQAMGDKGVLDRVLRAEGVASPANVAVDVPGTDRDAWPGMLAEGSAAIRAATRVSRFVR